YSSGVLATETHRWRYDIRRCQQRWQLVGRIAKWGKGPLRNELLCSRNFSQNLQREFSYHGHFRPLGSEHAGCCPRSIGPGCASRKRASYAHLAPGVGCDKLQYQTDYGQWGILFHHWFLGSANIYRSDCEQRDRVLLCCVCAWWRRRERRLPGGECNPTDSTDPCDRPIGGRRSDNHLLARPWPEHGALSCGGIGHAQSVDA